MSLKNCKLYKKGLVFIAIFIFSCQSAFSEDLFSEIHLKSQDKSIYFLDAIKSESVNREKNYAGKDHVKMNFDNNKDLQGLIEINVKEDKTPFFRENASQKFDAKAGVSKKINSFLDFNTEVSVTDLNNHSNIPAEVNKLNFSTDILPGHKLYFGQTTLYEKSSPSLVIFDKIEREYKLKNFESAEDIDLKLSGNKGFLNYSAGAYNINKTGSVDRWDKETSVAGGYASLNPLYPLSGIGDLQMGGGYFTNEYAINSESDKENTYSIFTGYKFDRFSVRGEFLREQNSLYDTQISDSWHLLNKFAVSDTFSFKTGFKQYEERNSTESNIGFEYSFKETPFIDNENLKLEFDATFRRGEQWENGDSERFGIKTKYLL